MHPCHWLSVCNLDTRTGPRESAVAFQLNSCFSASISFLLVVVVVVVAVVLFCITILCLFGDIPRLVSLSLDVRLLTSQL